MNNLYYLLSINYKVHAQLIHKLNIFKVHDKNLAVNRKGLESFLERNELNFEIRECYLKGKSRALVLGIDVFKKKTIFENQLS